MKNHGQYSLSCICVYMYNVLKDRFFVIWQRVVTSGFVYKCLILLLLLGFVKSFCIHLKLDFNSYI